MSDGTLVQTGPAIADTVAEVRGVFASDAALQAAIAGLTQAGFDRAELSLPEAAPPASRATPEQGAADPNTDTDDRQMRTLQASMAGSVGALAAAGAVLMTGGAALPAVAAAAAVGVGAGGLAHAMSGAANTIKHEDREAAASEGLLILSARIRDHAHQRTASDIMLASGATNVESISGAGPTVAPAKIP